MNIQEHLYCNGQIRYFLWVHDFPCKMHSYLYSMVPSGGNFKIFASNFWRKFHSLPETQRVRKCQKIMRRLILNLAIILCLVNLCLSDPDARRRPSSNKNKIKSDLFKKADKKHAKYDTEDPKERKREGKCKDPKSLDYFLPESFFILSVFQCSVYSTLWPLRMKAVEVLAPWQGKK